MQINITEQYGFKGYLKVNIHTAFRLSILYSLFNSTALVK